MDCPIARRVRRYLGFLVAAIALVPASAGSQTVQGAVPVRPAVPPTAQGQPPRDRVPRRSASEPPPSRDASWTASPGTQCRARACG